MFLHGGWFHLIGNMWFLWIFGNNVEDSMGARALRALLPALRARRGGAAGGGDPGSPIPMVGASGAIGGVMGAYVVLYPRVRVHLLLWFSASSSPPSRCPRPSCCCYWLALQLIGGAVEPRRGRRRRRVLGARRWLRGRACCWCSCSAIPSWSRVIPSTAGRRLARAGGTWRTPMSNDAMDRGRCSRSERSRRDRDGRQQRPRLRDRARARGEGRARGARLSRRGEGARPRSTAIRAASPARVGRSAWRSTSRRSRRSARFADAVRGAPRRASICSATTPA